MNDIVVIPKATIRVIGTSHIAQSSADEIRRVAEEFQPDAIAVELDRGRLDALRDPNRGKKKDRMPLSMIKRIGLTGYLFALIGKTLQKKLGSVVRVEPGVDMMAAVEIAYRKNLILSLVDQDIMITMKRLSAEFTFKEKMRVLWDIITAPFSKKFKFDISKVPEAELLDKLMGLLKDRYPSIYKVLIIERNIVMARNLDALVRKNPGKKILLVIGAGHGDDLRERLKLMENIAEII
jgi:pheromone shutdown-related protein TraB